jgi:tRNA nucleotidyltransferase (CCA-adding enzyme)
MHVLRAHQERSCAVKLDLLTTTIDRALVEAFGDDVYVIGGPVRDKLRHVFHGVPYEPKDRDYVITALSLEVVRSRLERIGRVDAVGASFGVLKLTVAGESTVDVALPRRERSTGWGHREFVIENGPAIPLEEDQARRDFLMNAVAVQLASGRLVDHPGAVEDIRARRITVINGRQSFIDDPLRILRAAQFSSRFEFAIEPGTFALMTELAELVRTVSPERINEELGKMLLKSPRPSEGVRILYRAGLLPMTIPGLERCVGVEQNQFHAFDVFEHALATLDVSRPTLESRWAALLHDIGKAETRSRDKADYGYTFYNHDQIGAEIAQTILEGLRYPKALIERVTRLIANHMYLADPSQSEAAIKRLINRIGVDLLDEQFHLRHCDRVGSGVAREERVTSHVQFEHRVFDILAKRPPLAIGDLAIDGHDVMETLIAAGMDRKIPEFGPLVGHVLRTLRDWVIDHPDLNRKEILIGEIARIAAEAVLPSVSPER